jgi:UDP-N-acetyl-D-mannosaminuronic acid dehydrogenase
LAYVPERLAPGRAMRELSSVPRIVGGASLRSTTQAVKLYSRVIRRLYKTDSTTAELTKVAENGFRDLNIAYANLLALVSEVVGADINEVVDLANTHPRVEIHHAGPGVGGPCLTKDPYMLLVKGVPQNVKRLVLAARSINDTMPRHMAKLVLGALENNGVAVNAAKVTILGTAYKGGTDDTRSSPTADFVNALLGIVHEVVSFDPRTCEGFNAVVAPSLKEAIAGTDAIALMTDHPEFRNLDLNALRPLVRTPIIIDGRHILTLRAATRAGFQYYAIGLGKKHP